MNEQGNNDQSYFTLIICASGLAVIGVVVLIMAIPLLIEGGPLEKMAGLFWAFWAPGAFYMSVHYIKKIFMKIKS